MRDTAGTSTRAAIVVLLVAALVFAPRSTATAQPNPSLSGTVTITGGGGIDGATVEVIDPTTSQVVANTLSTDSAGDYTVSVSTAGLYNVLVSAPGYQSSTESSVSITGSTTLDISLVPGGVGTVSGVLVDQAGNPLDCASLDVGLGGAGGSGNDVLDNGQGPTGAFSVTVPNGTYSLSVAAQDCSNAAVPPGYWEFQTENDFVVDGNTSLGDVAVPSAVVLSITVNAPNGQPLPATGIYGDTVSFSGTFVGLSISGLESPTSVTTSSSGTANYITFATPSLTLNVLPPAGSDIPFVTVPPISLSGDGYLAVEYEPTGITFLAAIGDSYSVAEGGRLDVSAPGVLANDIGPSGATLSAEIVNPPAHGIATLNSDGSFSYSPNLDYAGVDTFTYEDVVGSSMSLPATVTIDVLPTLESIGITPSGATLNAGDTERLVATGNYSDGSTEDLTRTASWSSSNSPVATVDSDGLVTALAPGTAMITASEGGVRTTATITVQTVTVKTAQTITITSTAPSPGLVTGTYTPTATASSGLTVAITVEPSSSAVCSIAAGVVTLNAAGSCQIDFNQPGNSSFAPAPQVTQTVRVGSVLLSSKVTLSLATGVGGTLEVTATVTPTNPPSTPIPTGTVKFTISGITCGGGRNTLTLVSGAATCTFTLTTGVQVKAAYLGDTLYAASSATQLMGPGTLSAPVAVWVGSSDAWTLNTQLSGGAFGAPAGDTVTFTSGGVTLCVATTDSQGVANCEVSPSATAVAGATFVANFGGDTFLLATKSANGTLPKT